MAWIVDEHRIHRVELFSGRMPVKTKFSFGERTEFKFNILRLHAAGEHGLGETIHPPSEELKILSRGLLGRRLDELDALLTDWQGQFAGYREMASISLHELQAKLKQVPLFQLLRNRDFPVTGRLLMPCLFRQEPEQLKSETETWRLRGYDALKIKLFGDIEMDLARINAVRSILKRGFLQADLNLGFKTFDLAARALPRFKEAGLDAVEDHMSGTFEDYRRLMDIPARPRLLLDEPSRGPENFRKIIQLRCCDAINLHPNQQGTLTELYQRARLANEAGIDVEFGGTGFTGIGAWAWAHVAAAYPSPYPIGEIGGAQDHGMPASTALAPLPAQSGQLVIDNTPGHGGQLDEDVLRTYCTEYSTWA